MLEAVITVRSCVRKVEFEWLFNATLTAEVNILWQGKSDNAVAVGFDPKNSQAYFKVPPHINTRDIHPSHKLASHIAVICVSELELSETNPTR